MKKMAWMAVAATLILISGSLCFAQTGQMGGMMQNRPHEPKPGVPMADANK